MFARRAFFIALFIIWVFALLTGTPAWCDEIIIGSGTGTTPYPFATAHQDARTQIIYLASEIGAAYKFTALSLDVTTIPGQTMNNFTIRMRHTSLADYPSPASWESTGWTTVYQANETITSTGWTKFTFTTPFSYNCVDNLMVDISYDNASSSTDGRCRYTLPGAIRMIYLGPMGGYGDPLTWSGSTPSPTRVNAIANIKLEIGSVAMPTFSPDGAIFDSAQNVTVSCATPGATIHYTTNGIDPTESDPVVASGSTVLVDHRLTLKARAWKAGLDPSSVKSALYAGASAILVKPDGDDANDGLSWETAKQTIQAGINAAVATDEVRVAAGTYVELITLKAGVGLYGGFVGIGTTRDIAAYVTTIDGNQAGSVVIGPWSATSTTVIDGFTIRNGKTYSGYSGYSGGGGIYCSYSSPTISNNTITGNTAYPAPDVPYGGYGGGIYCESSSPTITNNTITGNGAYAVDIGYFAYGGGIYCDGGSPTITNNTITGNSASAPMSWYAYGGGIYCSNSSPMIANNTITGNIAGCGGGIYCAGGSPTISNNTITGNSAYDYGGGIYCYWSSPTITNNMIGGNSGRAIYCYCSAPTITNNTIGGNTGGGISCDSSAPTITNNTITGNSAYEGGGICCEYSSSPTITNNTITGNGASSYDAYGGGIYCGSASSPTITNNTITGNTGGGIYCSGSGSPALTNNIVAFNSSGIYKSGTGTPTLQYNDVYGNASYDYSGISPGTGDISLDPLLAGRAYGNVHIQPSSRCINAGWNGAPGLPATDMDGQPRIQNGTVDIGADESDGTTWPSGPYVIVRVSPTGSDANDGSTWALAKRTVQAGIDAASALGGEVWVRAGTYAERIALRRYAHVYGGFAGTETSRSQRNWRTNVTILDGGAGGSVVTAARLGYQLSAIDGFTIRNGRRYYGGGIYCSYSSPTISNNTITGNTTISGAYYGAGICCEYSSSPTITNNTIGGNTGGGISCDSSSPTITNNTIGGNSGRAIYCYCSAPTITNNTIRGNIAGNAGVIYCDSSSATISNNIVAFNSSGIYKSGNTPVLRYNDVYANTAYNYSGISADPTDISQDPLFADQSGGDLHLQTGSPCIDTGTNTGAPVTDLDGAIRPQDGNGDGSAICDIGAYEYPMNLANAKQNAADGTALAFGGVPVTACFASPARIYVERADRSQGIRVDTDKTFPEGELVNTSGTIGTDSTTGERYVLPSSSYPATMNAISVLNPCAMVNRFVGGADSGLQQGVLGGAGLNNIGLLVTIWGNVTFSGTDYFYVDDGSKLNDDSGHIGVKVSAPGFTIPTGGFVIVTGISSCEKKGSELVRVLRVRKQADILPL